MKNGFDGFLIKHELSSEGIWDKYSYKVCHDNYDDGYSYMFKDAMQRAFLLSFRYISTQDAEQQ